MSLPDLFTLGYSAKRFVSIAGKTPGHHQPFTEKEEGSSVYTEPREGASDAV